MNEKDIEEIKLLLRENNSMLKELVSSLHDNQNYNLINSADIKDLLKGVISNLLASYLENDSKIRDLIQNIIKQVK